MLRTNGAAYWLYLKDPVSKTPYSTWSEFSTGNVADFQLNTQRLWSPVG